MDYQKMDELNKLHQAGALTDEEFEAEKQKILNSIPVAQLPFGLTENTCLGLMSFLILVPSVGWICPLVLWLTGREASQKIDHQGKIILNWMITWLIVGMIAFALCFVLVGFPVLIAISVLCIVFPIMGGLKGMNGEVWEYPLSYEFFK